MTRPSRRGVRWVVLIAAAAAVTAVLAVRVTRRKPGAEPDSAPERRSVPEPGAASVPRRWGALIAGPAAAIVVLSVALVATWPVATEPFPASPHITPDPYSLENRIPVVPFRTAEPPEVFDSPTSDVRTPPHPRAPASWPDRAAIAATTRKCMPSARPTVRFPLPTQASETSLEALKATPCQTLTAGETATIDHLDGMRMEVTASLTPDPGTGPAPPKGRHRVAVQLHIRDVNTPGLQLPFIWVFGAARDAGWIFSADTRDPTVWLQPGDEADQIVAFDLNQKDQLARLRLGLPPTTIDWVLDKP